MRRWRFWRTSIVCIGATALLATHVAGREEPASFARLDDLPVLGAEDLTAVTTDWLVAPVERRARVGRTGRGDVVLTNGLVTRRWRLAPNAATIAIDDLMTGASLLRGVKPEARVEIDGVSYDVGGLAGQVDYAYLDERRLDDLEADPAALRFTGLDAGPIAPRLAWKRSRYAADLPWPPRGVRLSLRFSSAPESAPAPVTAPAPRPGGLDEAVTVTVHHVMYDGLPLVGTWLEVHNGSDRSVRLDSLTSVILAIVEAESSVDEKDRYVLPNVHVESEYAFGSMHPGTSNRTARWVADPQYLTQVNYARTAPMMLVSRPPLGPDRLIEPGESFVSHRTWLLVHDSTERERRGLAVRRMYRTLAPWVTENPILMHVRSATPDAVRLAVDQCADVGFEMVIMTFGSGFDIENDDPAYIAGIRDLVDYAHERGVELGGYSLLASRRIDDANDAINPRTGAPGGMIFGNSPCLGSVWGRAYFRKLRHFIAETGLDVLEHDGSYPGDACASDRHPEHRGLDDSQWAQWSSISGFYRWCRARGVYLNVPDFYVLSGSSKVGMGYRETNWSLPRARQIIHARQNIFDGTWEKTPSMGWMFVPLVPYHGGGAAATLEPLAEHLADYEAHLANNFGSGVQACYRGPRLYDAPETRALVARWVGFYKRYRRILDADIIHVRRADGRDVDCMLHVDPGGSPCGLAMVYNPLDRVVERELELPLYYTGLTETATIREREGPPVDYGLDREYRVRLPIRIAPRSFSWYVIE